MNLEAPGPFAVISPHFDDAVFSCGDLLAAHPGSTVVTVFGGAPPGAEDRVTDWDRHCGFANAAEAMAIRRLEDAEALALLGARPVVLDFCDSQYGMTPTCGAIADALKTILRDLQPAWVLYPLGLFHSDHLLVHAACTEALVGEAMPSLAYEDALYRALPGLLQRRLLELSQKGFQATPSPLPAPAAPVQAALKRQAILAYDSQLHAFGEGGYADTGEAERYWRLEPLAAPHPERPTDAG